MIPILTITESNSEYKTEIFNLQLHRVIKFSVWRINSHCHRLKSVADYSPLVIAPRRARFRRSHLQIRATAIAYQLDASIYPRERSSQARCLLDWSRNTLTLKGHYTNLRLADRRTQKKNRKNRSNTRIKCVQYSTCSSAEKTNEWQV